LYLHQLSLGQWGPK